MNVSGRNIRDIRETLGRNGQIAVVAGVGFAVAIIVLGITAWGDGVRNEGERQQERIEVLYKESQNALAVCMAIAAQADKSDTMVIGCQEGAQAAQKRVLLEASEFETWIRQDGLFSARIKRGFPTDSLDVIDPATGQTLTGRAALDYMTRVTPVEVAE